MIPGVRRVNAAEQFRVMAFAQLTWRESLREIEVTLGANANKLYAMSPHHAPHRSTLADANYLCDGVFGRIWMSCSLGVHASTTRTKICAWI